MLQQEHPDDYVIATGETHSVREFVERAFAEVGIEIQWEGTGIDEVGIDKKKDQVIVRIDPRYFRPSEVDLLIGDNSKARAELVWEPKTCFSELIRLMVQSVLWQSRRTKQHLSAKR